jgi:UDP-N-acetylglucosamine 2-epimerase (non-hydrolysing)/GDP/UDP-N,N'-diacetylbacillosamine 2-epimerase (hydrolysing)
MKRKIAVFTGNRAEYGLQFPILKAIEKHPNLEYILLVSGAHLDSNFGATLDEIKSDGFQIGAEIKIKMDGSNLYATTAAIGNGILEISRVLDKIKPDMMLVYADRFEGFSAVIAATQQNIPTAHIEGGDLTEGGALDDSVRHAMTKLSHLHFTTNEQATNRILAMGEESWRVHTVGFPAIDLISENNFATKEEILDRFPLDLEKPIVIFTQHSITTEFEKAKKQILPSLNAIEKLTKVGVQVILTYPNNDAGGQAIADSLNDFSKKNLDNTFIIRSLGRYLYHGLLSLARESNTKVLCMGNSSSGIKETPAFGCPTLNIGSRQDGRLRAINVIDCDYSADQIYQRASYALFDQEFKAKCRNLVNPYWLGGAGNKIATILANTEINSSLLRKRMVLKGEKSGEWYR